MKKKYRRPLLIILALFFLVESWLWEKTGEAIGRVLSLLPLDEVREKITVFIRRLSPYQTLGLFIIPALVLLPLKFLALWLLAKGFLFSGVFTIFGAKLVGLGVTSFLFALCKPTLLEIRWIYWLYHRCLEWREKAYRLVKPYTRYIHRLLSRFKSRGSSGTLWSKIRRKMHQSRHKAEP